MDNSNKGWDEYIITWARDKSVDGLLRCHRCALPPGRIKVLVRTSSDVSFEPRQRVSRQGGQAARYLSDEQFYVGQNILSTGNIWWQFSSLSCRNSHCELKWNQKHCDELRPVVAQPPCSQNVDSREHSKQYTSSNQHLLETKPIGSRAS